VATEGITGFYVETANYGATAALWASLGYTASFETGHGSGQWDHPGGGPYVFIAERQGGELVQYPILGVADSTTFAPDRELIYAKPFTPEHWGVVEAHVTDPDGRIVALHAPLPPGVESPDAEAHHAEKYG
jgi:hypothetical protein